MNSGGLFITGTGTDVGKTVVSAVLLRQLRRLGINAAPMKPVQTGCQEHHGQMDCPDLDLSLKVSEMKVTDEEYHLMGPCRYLPACSPHLAGKMAGVYADPDLIDSSFEELKRRYEFILAEGAGGAMVPLDNNWLTTELIRSMNLPALIVSTLELGTINHTLMTVQTLRSFRIPIEGILFTQTQPPNRDNRYIIEDNPGIIVSQAKVPLLGILPYKKDILGAGMNRFIRYEAPMLYNYIRRLAEKIKRNSNEYIHHNCR